MGLWIDVATAVIAVGAAALWFLSTRRKTSNSSPSDEQQREGVIVNHPNRDLIKRTYDAFGRGDIPTVLGILDKQIRWHVPGQSPLSGDYSGHEEVLGFFRKSWNYRGEPCASMCMTSLRATRGFLCFVRSARPDLIGMPTSWKCTFGALLTAPRLSFASFKVTNTPKINSGLSKPRRSATCAH